MGWRLPRAGHSRVEVIAMAKMPVIEFEEIVKEYPTGLFRRDKLRAVDRVGFRVEAGEVFGLLGPNRAGKTTLVKILLSLCRPTSGRAQRLGRTTTDRSTLRRVGYVHENPAFPRYLSAPALLEYYGALSLTPYEEVRRKVGPLLEQVGLADRSKEPIARFSKGMIQRLSVAQALINDPELLVLDEPNEGLDLPGRQLVRNVITDLRRRGRAVLLISHVSQEVESVCDRVAVIKRGKLKYLGSVASLTLSDPASGSRRTLEQALKEIYDQDGE
jgi:ABC-2 type transport system ATP-binding protein